MSRSMRSPRGHDHELRARLHDHAVKHLATAMGAGYYIEAVALVDSMISDRLEELLGLQNDHVVMNTLGQLAQLSRSMDPNAFSDLAVDVLEWAERRNVVVHQMVKVGPTHGASWSERLSQARRTAEAGLELLDAVNLAVADYEHGVEYPTDDTPAPRTTHGVTQDARDRG